MTKSINKQVEAQGVKKLDSFKGFQELNVQELQEIEGGNFIDRAWQWMKKHVSIRPKTFPVRDQITGRPYGNGTAYGGKATVTW